MPGLQDACFIITDTTAAAAIMVWVRVRISVCAGLILWASVLPVPVLKASPLLRASYRLWVCAC